MLPCVYCPHGSWDSSREAAAGCWLSYKQFRTTAMHAASVSKTAPSASSRFQILPIHSATIVTSCMSGLQPAASSFTTQLHTRATHATHLVQPCIPGRHVQLFFFR